MHTQVLEGQIKVQYGEQKSPRQKNLPETVEISATPKNNHQLHEQENKRKKATTHEFNEIRQLLTSSGKKGREILLNQSSTKYNQ